VTFRTVRRRELAIALAAYGVLLGLVLLAPTSGPQSTSAGWVADLVTSVGVPERIATGARVEFVLNAVILMPVSALGSLLWPRTTWRDWTGYAFVIAGTVELVQGLFLPQRSATFVDVVANTLGGLGGAALVAAARGISRRRRAGGTPPTPPARPRPRPDPPR
jgi:hypothetical protein